MDDEVTNQDLQDILFRGKYANASPYTVPDFEWIHRELARKGVHLTLLWTEYCDKVRSTGGVPYMYTQFCEKYRRWARVTKAMMRISHKPGDAIQVDWAGDPRMITNPNTGEENKAYIFIAVLPCSWYTYAEACENMQTENWLLCHDHAFNYFGGAGRLLIPDNCRTATTSNARYETVLNRRYQERAEHYGTAIVPARVRKPDDKAAAEGSVRFASTWITASLRDQKFFSIVEVQRAVAEKLEELNLRRFRKRPGCRLTAFEQEEKAFLRPLLTHPYEPAIWTNPKVGYDYLVSDGLNKYSVPYDLIGKTVDVRLTRNAVEIFYNGSRVATHLRFHTAQWDPITKPEHMPESHRKYLRYSTEEFTAWADTIGSATKEVVQHFLTSGREPEQGFKPCASLTKLAERCGKVRLEDACARVLRLTSAPTIRNITALCKSTSPGNPDTLGKENPHTQTNEGHGVTRGASYYSKEGKRHDEPAHD